MVFLTGDVHHRSLRTKEAPYISPLTEIDLAGKYLKIAAAFGLKVTLFITGRTFLEEIDKVDRILRYENLEIGGHTFNGFYPLWLHKGFKAIRGSYWRSYAHQCREVEKTIEVTKRTTGLDVTSWRNHSYEHDRHTADILAKSGITVWSDIVDVDCRWPRRVAHGLVTLSINIVQDHNMLYHGYRTEQWVAKRNEISIRRHIKKLILKRELRPEEGYHAAEWFTLLRENVESKMDRSIAVLNLHPVCMYLLDKFRTFENVCRFLSQYESRFAKEAAEFEG